MKHIRILLLAVMLILGITAYGQYNPSNPAEPGVYYTLTLKCFPENAGSFNIGTVTTQSQGVGVNLRAYANTGFKFIGWEERGNQISTDASYNFTMRGYNTTLVAKFEYDPNSPSEPSQPNLPKYATINIGVSPDNSGTLNISDGNKYEVGSSIKLSTSNKSNFTFVNWTQNGEIISTATSFNYVVKESNPLIVANYRYEPGSPSEPGKPSFQRALMLECNPKGAGYFNVSSGNKYTSGSSVKLTAYAYKDYVFKNWTKDGVVISDSYTFSYTMPEIDSKLVANYEYVYSPGNPGEPNSPTDKDLSIYGMTEKIFPGQTINYPIYLQNNQDVIGLIIDVRFPDVITPDLTNIVLSGRGNGHEIAYETVEDGYIRFTVIGDEAFGDVNGKIFDVPVTASDNAIGNQEYSINLTHGVVVLSDKTQLPVLARDGNITVEYAAEGSIYARFSYDKFQNRVKFTNQSAKESTRYEWDFGDGNSSTNENPLHIYAAPGTYKVVLTAYNGNQSVKYEQNVLINDERTWVASGNFTLGLGDNGVRCFSSLEELLTMLGKSRIDDDIIINVESGKEFSVSLSGSDIENLRSINTALTSGNYNMMFIKTGNSNNPLISYGVNLAQQFDKNTIDLIVDLGKHQNYRGVYNRKNEMSIFQKRNEQIFSFFASFFLWLFRPLKHQLNAD